MIPSLDPRTSSQILRNEVRFGADADDLLVQMVKRSPNEDRNLSLGVLTLLETYGAFKAQLAHSISSMYAMPVYCELG